MSIQYATTLFMLGATEMLCFYALRTPGFKAWWAFVAVELSISACIGVLIISPAMVFFTTGTTTAWFGVRLTQLKFRLSFREAQRERLRAKLTNLQARRRNGLKYFQASAEWNARVIEKIEDHIAEQADASNYFQLNDLFKLHEQGQNNLAALREIIEETESEIALEAESTVLASDLPGPAIDSPSDSFDYRLFDPHFRG